MATFAKESLFWFQVAKTPKHKEQQFKRLAWGFHMKAIGWQIMSEVAIFLNPANLYQGKFICLSA